VTAASPADRASNLFRQALSLQQQGRPEDAARLCDEALREAPRHVDSLNLRGVLALHMGDAADAARHFRKALTVRRDVAEVHGNLGTALLRLGRADDAVASFERAITLKPDSASMYFGRGSANLKRGAHAAAVRDLDRAIALRPSYPTALLNRGLALAALGKPDVAAESYREAIRLEPLFAEARANLASLLMAAKRYHEALNLLDEAIALRQESDRIHLKRGDALFHLNRTGEALVSFDRAIALAPDFADAHHYRAKALQDLHRLGGALASVDRAIAIAPTNVDAYLDRATILADLHRWPEALDALDRGIAVKPDDATSHWTKAAYLRQLGRFEEGSQLAGWRKKLKEPAGKRDLPKPLWTGSEPVDGRRVFLHWEQGLGDTLQFCRYAWPLRARGAEVFLAVQDPLLPLMRQWEPAITILGASAVPDRYDLQAPLQDMPLAFGTTLATIPADVPYLRVEPERVERWRDRIGPDGFRIAICWQGSMTAIDRGRSFSAACFEGLSHLPGVRLISLQKGPAAAQLSTLPAGMRVETLGEEFDPPGAAFLDSAAVMQVCDLVITSDTSVAHLAGAIGVATWVVLKHVPEWRWLIDREDSPWYPTMRLFRQPAPGDWAGTFQRVEAAVGALIAARAGQPLAKDLPAAPM
jgi:tetratricopeptide (TPR) repeat protein